MHDFTQSNPDVPVFSLSYEDMKKDPVSNIKRLAKFLEVDVSDKLCEEIAEACSFHRMKEFEKEKEKVKFGEGEADPLPAEGANKDGQEGRLKPVIYRKGETGDWKNYLTVAMSEQIDAMAEEKMKGLPFTLQYT
nr:hypothetical protein BaRGS_010590 [Batillaria attramentaria]